MNEDYNYDISESQIEQIINLDKDGVSKLEIASQTDMPIGVVDYWVRKGRARGKVKKAKKQCKMCAYGDNQGLCMYLLIKGKRRPCTAENCAEFTQVVGKRDSTFSKDDNGLTKTTKKQFELLMYSGRVITYD